MIEGSGNESLGSLRKKSFSWSAFFHAHCPFLFNIRSLFYFFWLIFFLGLLWMAFGLLTNSFTQFYPWTDYFGQYVTMAYEFHDTWRNFFRTGYFELYSASTYLGSDNIGSNSYYGLFDPFLFFCYIFPRAWIPQTFAIATVLKGICGAFATRAYLRYLGVSERGARLGAAAFAFNGYINFMVGFPSFVSMAFTVPLIYLGIEQTLRERKITWLVIGLGLLGLISFFFLVVVSIFGVLYALWRFFMTLKSRDWKGNCLAMLFGVLAFLLGIALSAWTLFPSLRQSALSGRTTSIGKAYLDSLLLAFKDQDFGTIFGRLFEMVGRHPGRELQALIGFFYPTIGYRYSPLAGGGYDAWTASLFCYTPFVLLLFIALFSSARRKKWSHLVAFGLISYLLFTNFAYYFFYAFTGDGYGRWYIVLIPIILYYGAQEFDRLKEEPKWLLAAGQGTAFFLTLLTWVLTVTVLRGKTFPDRLDGYWQNSYQVPYTFTYDGLTLSFLWVVYLQIAFVAIEGILIFLFRKREVLGKILLGFVLAETILWGNISFVDNSPFRVDDLVNSNGQVIASGWNGGNAYRETATAAMKAINASDDGFFRTFLEGSPEANAAMAFGSNGTSNFHSLFNYEVNQLSLYIHANRPTYKNDTYAYGQTYYSHGWSAYYGNKRLGADSALGMKYYATRFQGYGELEGLGDNVPWGSKLVYGDKTSALRFYKNPNAFDLGHGVDLLYSQGVLDAMVGTDSFYGNYGEGELLRNDQALLEGAIVSDEEKEPFLAEAKRLALGGVEDPETLFQETPKSQTMLTSVSYRGTSYLASYDWWGPDTADGGHAGPTYFLSDPNVTKTSLSTVSSLYYAPDRETIVLTPRSGATYFNNDPRGAYFSINYDFDSAYSQNLTRVTLIGDTFEEDGVTLKEENVLLSYDYETLRNFAKRKIGGSGSEDVFGFYPEGKVKYICFNAKPSDFGGEKEKKVAKLPWSISILYAERGDLEKNYLSLYKSSDYALTDVHYDKNEITFQTAFSKPKTVVTELGYDAGWSLYTESGEKLPVFKLNGGLVGFIAPAGENRLTLHYMTPYLKEGVLLASGALAVFSAVQIGGLALYLRRKRKEAEASLPA